VSADAAGEGIGIQFGRAEVIARLPLDLVPAFGFAADHADHGEAGKDRLHRIAAVGEQPNNLMADSMPPGFDPAMIGVDRSGASELGVFRGLAKNISASA
jgi:hypothetical protein